MIPLSATPNRPMASTGRSRSSDSSSTGAAKRTTSCSATSGPAMPARACTVRAFSSIPRPPPSSGSRPSRRAFSAIPQASPTGSRAWFPPTAYIWTRYPEPICPLFADSQYSGFWDQRLGQYVIYGRVGGRGRALGRAASERFDQFEPLSLVLQTDQRRSAGQRPLQSGLHPASDASSVYLMCPSLYQHKPDTLDIRLAVSRNGVDWTWPQRETPFIPLGKPGESTAARSIWPTAAWPSATSCGSITAPRRSSTRRRQSRN